MSRLPYPFPELAEKLYIPSSYDELYNITKYDLLEKEGYLYIVCEADLHTLKLFNSLHTIYKSTLKRYKGDQKAQLTMKQYNGDINLKNTSKAPRNILNIFF